MLLILLLVASAQARASTVEQQIASLPVIQPFNGETNSTSMFTANWTAFAWAAGKGVDTTSGWSVSPAYPTVNGAYYSAASYTATAGGAAATVTMAANPTYTSRYFSLWLDASNEIGGAKAGYELRFTMTGTNTYSVVLAKWEASLETVLASAPSVTFANGNSLAIADQGDTVTAWTNTGSGYTQLLSARDAAFGQGSVGLSGAGNITKLTAFHAGQLNPAAPALTATSPASPSSSTTPLVIGSAAPGTTVKLFTNETCMGTPVATGTAAALASPGIQVTVASNTTTTFYATATDNLGNVSDCSSGIPYTERTPETASMLADLPSVNSFTKIENPLSGEGGFTKLAWASHPGQVAGSGTSVGWGPYYAFPTVHGAYWNEETYTDSGEGAAVAATLSVSPSSSERYFSLWLDMPSPESAQTGYELRFTQTATANTYNVTLSKWQSGTRTVLATQANYAFATQSSFALVDKGAMVSAWTDTGSGYGQLLSASDATFERGYAGIEGTGNIGRIRLFKAGDSTAGYTGVKHIGTAEAQYQSEANTFTYRAESGSPPMTGHYDPVATSASGTSLPYTTEAVTCATSGHRIKVVYSSSAYPATASSEVQTAIRSAVGRINAKIAAESLRSSGNTRALTLRVDCDETGAVRIYNLSVGPDNPENIQAAAKEAFGAPRGAEAVKYLIFRDAPAYQGWAAGFGYFYPEEAKKSSADDETGNRNRTTTFAGIIYRGSVAFSMWQTDATVHELFHTMGAVMHPRGDYPPYATDRSHCTDGVDIMCYDDGSPQVYTETRCPPAEYLQEPSAIQLDCGNDTYFNASASAGGWLGTHWNVGGSENPFLAQRPAEIPVGGAETATFITIREVIAGPPSTTNVYGHVNTTNAGGNLVNNAYVNVNFQHWENGEWVTKQIVHPTVTNSYYEANGAGSLGVGRWRVRAVFSEQGYYHESKSEYHEFTVEPVPTEAFLTVDQTLNGQPGYASVHGHVLRNGNPVSGTVNVNFQKLVNGNWETMSTAQRALDSNGYYEVKNWGVGVGQWRVRAVFPEQSGYAQSESEYHYFQIKSGYRLIGRQSGRCLSLSANNGTNGTAMILWDCSGAPNPGDGQVFTLVPMDTTGQYYELKINSSGKCVDVTGVSMENGAYLQEWECLGAGQANQLWDPTPISGQPPYEALIAKHSGKCMDVLGQATGNGARVGQWECWWGGNQQWSWQAIE